VLIERRTRTLGDAPNRARCFCGEICDKKTLTNAYVASI
jgi:hypothetical protein